MKAADISDRLALALIGENFPKAFNMLVAKGFPPKVVWAKYQKLDRRGLIQYGVSLRLAWLTPEGEQYLATLQAGSETKVNAKA